MNELDPSAWPVAELADCAEIVSGGTPSKGEPANWGGNVPWVSAKDMKLFRLHDAQDHVTSMGARNGTRVAPRGSSLVLVRGMTLHDHVPVCWLRSDAAFNQDVKAIIPKAHVDSEYLAYWLCASERRLHGLVDAAGHGTGRIGGPALASLPVRLPPRQLQRAIARSLGALDRKIEINARIVETLGSVAGATFAAWFVDCASTQATSPGCGTGEHASTATPRGRRGASRGERRRAWRLVRLADVADVDRDIVSPRDFGGDLVDHYSIPAFDAHRMPIVEAGSSIRSSKFRVHEGSVLLSRLNPRTPRVWLPQPASRRQRICSTEFLVLRPKQPVSLEFLHGHLLSASFCEEFASLVTGTSGSHQRVRPTDAMSIGLALPPTPMIEAYSRLVRPMLQQCTRLYRETELLGVVRSRLLPRLVAERPLSRGGGDGG